MQPKCEVDTVTLQRQLLPPASRIHPATNTSTTPATRALEDCGAVRQSVDMTVRIEHDSARVFLSGVVMYRPTIHGHLELFAADGLRRSFMPASPYRATRWTSTSAVMARMGTRWASCCVSHSRICLLASIPFISGI